MRQPTDNTRDSEPAPASGQVQDARRSTGRAWTTFLGALAMLAVSMVVAAGIGAVHYSPAQVIHAALHGPPGATDDDIVLTTLWLLRLPRILMAALVGASLAVAGVAFQSLLRNELADPYVVGVSGGASVGAEAILMRHGEGWLHGMAAPAAALGGAVTALSAVYGIARRGGRLVTSNLLLGGVIVGMFLGAVSTLLLQFGEPGDSFRIITRLMGSLQDPTVGQSSALGLALAIGTVVLLSNARAMNVFSLGEEQAAQLGVEVERFKTVLMLAGSLLTAVTVSSAGMIGFVGLVVPHFTRIVAGTPRHERVIPLALLFGAILMVWADTLARSVAPGGRELPVGVITAFLGAPYFCYLLTRRKATTRG